MKSYTLEKTKNKDLFRVVDLSGNWNYYFHKPSGLYLRSVTYILDSGYYKGKGFDIYLRKTTLEESERKLKDAGERGDKVHKAIDYLFENNGKISRKNLIWNDDTEKEEMLDHDEWECIIAFKAFWDAHKPILVISEFPTYNLGQRYAGTLDAMLTLTKRCENVKCPCGKLIGKLGLFDWKSSTGIRNSYGAQTAAYAHGDNVEKYDYTAILRIGTNHKIGYEFEAYNKKKTDGHYKEFLAATTIADADHKPFDPQKEIVEIPDTISITLQKKAGKPKAEGKKPKKVKA